MTGGSDASIQGQIVLEHSPFCASFVVQTDRGFSILDWDEGILVFAKGDEVYGPLHTRGMQSISLVGHGEMTVRVGNWMSDPQSAREAFRGRCKLDAEEPRTVALIN
jgi:hypothetical protein